MAEGLDPVSEAVALWVLVPDMWLAYRSMVLFIAVVVTSLVAVRRRFPYEFWYAVHLLTYAAVLTSLPHQFSVGGLFAEGTWQRWYWLALCIATGAALLHYRVAQPLVATFPAPADRQAGGAGGPGSGEHRDVRPATWTSWRAAAAGSLSGGSWLPGLWWHPHPFSLSADPVSFDAAGQGTLRITVRNLGRGSAQLASLKPGTKVALEGPYGLFSTAARSRNHVVMVGAGIGITPFRALLESTPFQPGNATVILRGHSESELYLGQEILDLCRRRGATLFHLTGPRPAGVRTWLPENSARAATGWPAMTRTSPTPTCTSAAPPPGHKACFGTPAQPASGKTAPLRKVRLVRTRAAVSAALASAGILLAGWQSGVHIADTSSSVASAAAGTTGTTGAEALGTTLRAAVVRVSVRRGRAPRGPRPRPAGRTPAPSSRPGSAPSRCRSPCRPERSLTSRRSS